MATKTQEVAVIDPQTGNPKRDADGEIVMHTVDPKTGAPVEKKAPAKKKAKQ